MVIGREFSGQIVIADRLRDPVRLRAGLGEHGVLEAGTVQRALESLERFRQRLVEVPPDRIRAVGTHTFRHTKEPADLLERCGSVLGVPIEILPGPEEARLVYLGVAHGLGHVEGRRLVVDIGGGSTAFFNDTATTAIYTNSMGMGCVSFSERFFPGGKLTLKAFQKAEIAARVELETIERRYRKMGWQEVVGSSGTIRAVEDRQENAATLELPGLAPERRPVFAGGLAILKGVFQSFEIESLKTSRAALREGVLYDLLGRIRHEDVRDRTIRGLSERHHVDQRQAERVERSALLALGQVHEEWELDLERSRQLLSWAARLHEVGMVVAFSGHHRHGAYLLANAAMPGFSREEQLRLATLVRCHRRKISTELFAGVSGRYRQDLLKLCVLLRLAVLLNRARSPRPPNVFELGGGPAAPEIAFPEGWLADHSLVRADIEQEILFLGDVGVQLRAR
jgi:exopolyphosphatase/guanosine-5'-triphosphate,3'-diphosphate pyrophosphatase